MGQVAGNKSGIVSALPRACSDELAAVEFMEQQRWGDSPACPRCGVMDVYAMRGRDGERNKRFLWRCRGCAEQYTVRIGTVFEDSRIPLKHWCYAFWAACASKKGVSALQIKRQTGLSYKSALFMMHRIRYAMVETPSGPLTGIVEADETYVGGRARGGKVVVGVRMKGGKSIPRYKVGRRRDAIQRKTPVMAVVQRGGQVRAEVPTHVSSVNLYGMLHTNVSPDAHLMTDEMPAYRPLGKMFRKHSTVMHTRGEYARGDVTTNTVEGFFSLLKRGLVGTFHSVSRKHLHRYVAEFVFRYNRRGLDDGARTGAAIRSAEGKRLLYREQIA
jgi:transposase-like protein